MSVTKQLYQLQEVDLELESTERTLRQVTGKIGESEKVVRVRSRLASEQQHLEELRHQQHSLEWEVDDLGTKIARIEQKLYGGSIGNPKELANFQQEAEGMKLRRGQLEDKTLDIMDRVERAVASVDTTSSELERLEDKWQSEQKQLSVEAERLKTTLSELDQKRQRLSSEIDTEMVELYQQLKKQKGTAVAKVEQGICRGCRISLSASESQRVRSGDLSQCSSCGRILFLA
jgi:predicted  nucleic acid-binding Zn-ribbon protein